jgi:hypothetical protein
MSSGQISSGSSKWTSRVEDWIGMILTIYRDDSLGQSAIRLRHTAHEEKISLMSVDRFRDIDFERPESVVERMALPAFRRA